MWTHNSLPYPRTMIIDEEEADEEEHAESEEDNTDEEVQIHPCKRGSVYWDVRAKYRTWKRTGGGTESAAHWYDARALAGTRMMIDDTIFKVDGEQPYQSVYVCTCVCLCQQMYAYNMYFEDHDYRYAFIYVHIFIFVLVCANIEDICCTNGCFMRQPL